MEGSDRQIRIELCGEVRLEINGRRRERELPGRLGRILLGYLALNRRRAVPRDELIGALWPDTPPGDPGATLSTLLSGLRRTLGAGVVRGRGQLTLTLPPDARLDVEEALDDLRQGRPERALEVLERILLPGFEAPWLDEHRRELEDERLTALELLARDALARGDAHRAHSAARRLAALAPYRESGYALLMKAQEAQGNVAEALQTYDRLRELMREELGTAPSAELRTAHTRLLDAPAARAFPAPLARAAARPFVGRAGVLALLRDRLAGGERRFVFLAGEPGIGKTSVAAVFAREAHEHGATALYGRSDEDAIAPYQPFVEMLDEPLTGPGTREGGEYERYRLFDAVASALTRLGSPLLVICDDLHWADRPTLLLVRHLARAAEPDPLLFLGTYRDTEMATGLSELIADLRREHAFERVSLSGLDQAETSRLLADLPVQTAQHLHQLTSGHPLFLEEMVRALDDEDAEAIPEGIKEVVLRRVARADAHDPLVLAAVAGQTFGAALLDDATIDRALSAGLVTTTDQPDRLAFSHALIRQTLYEQLSEPRRIALHQRIAESLEQGARRDPAELAHHYFRARHAAGPEPAIRYAREAADRAAETLAWEDEAQLLERALEADALRQPPDEADRAELLLALGEARTRGGHGTARAAFADAAALARGHSPEQLARAAIGYGGRYYEAGVVDPELIALLHEALETAEDAELRSRLLARLAEIMHFAGETETSIRLAQEALTLAGRLGDDTVLAAALAGRHVSLLHVAHARERLAVSNRIHALAGRDPRLRMQALQARIFDRLTLGDVAGAREDHARLDELARTLREPLFVHFAVGWACTFAQIDGRLEDAERLALESFELRQQLKTRDAESVLAAQLFMIRRAQGRVAELLPAVAAAVEQHPALAVWRTALPLVHAAAGDDRLARHELEQVDLAALPRDFFWLTAITLLSEAAALLGAAGPAERLYRELAPFTRRFVQIGYAASDGPVERSLGLLARARGDTAAARTHLEDALRICTAAGAPAFERRARADLAAAESP